ncbi:MAG: zinc-binding alcohol dehydrogenase family protein [Pseudonocardiales bacterium]|nr:MAG: zinc-binding alcohol dehydrogenase family protein [Pseudonocardiales bacterium]
MRVVAYRSSLPISERESLVDVEAPVPIPGPRDLLVRVHAVSVNPVDVKQRQSSDPGGEPTVLGWDAAGVVEAIGAEVTLFEVGDEVYYAGAIDRPGTNSQLHAVDERIVGPKPTTLTFSEAAALPLTSIVAWEALFDRFALTAKSTGTLLVMGAAGGAGSMAVQLAAARTDMTIVGTASDPESQSWVRELGADQVIDHHDLVANVKAVAPAGVGYVFSTHSADNVGAFAEILNPGGEVVAIDDPEALDLLPLKSKSISWHWELMFTRSLFRTDDMVRQHELLSEVAKLVDAGTVRTTMTIELEPFDAATMRHAHELLESGHTRGKVVVTGFPA